MPLKRYPEWQELSFEADQKKHPLVTMADDEGITRPASKETSKKENRPDSCSKILEDTSPMLLYKQQIHTEVQEIKGNAPDYLAARKIERKPGYHDTTREEKTIAKIGAWFIFAIAPFGSWISLFCLTRDPWNHELVYSLVPASAIICVTVFVLFFIYSIISTKKKTAATMKDALCDSVFSAGIAYWIVVIFSFLFLCN